MTRALALALVLATASASAAELPSRSTKPNGSGETGRKAKTCDINGQAGLLLPNGTCLRMSGSITAGVEGGNIKP